MKKRIVFIVIGTITLLLLLYMILPGFGKIYEVGLMDYKAINEQVIQIKTGVMSSIGYTRCVRTTEIENKCYCTFYSAFGGINGSIGANNTFDIIISKNIDEIYFEREGDNKYLMLVKNKDTKEWERPNN